MTLHDVVLHAFSNLRRQKLRTSLTVTGVALGVATIVIMVSFGAGVRKIVAEKFDRAELLTQIQVTPVKLPSISSFGDLKQMMGQKPKPHAITDDTIAELKRIPGVKAVYPLIRAPLTMEFDGKIDSVQTEGLPLDALPDDRSTILLAGAYWKDDVEEDVTVFPSAQLSAFGWREPREAIGKELVVTRFDEYFKYEWLPPQSQPEAKDAEGKPIPRRAVRRPEAKTRTLRIAGVYDSDQFGISGGWLHVPLPIGKELLRFSGMGRLPMFGKVKEGEYGQLIVKIADRRDAPRVRESIEALDYGTLMTIDFLKWINVFFALVEAGLAVFGGIGLFVACFGIANTMLMAVLERTREIGVLKALGGRDRDVRRIFLLEAAGIGVLGGLVGVGVGKGIGMTLNAIVTWMAKDETAGATLQIFYIPWWLAVGSIGVAAVVAAFSGLYPAWRAAKLDPVEALRRE